MVASLCTKVKVRVPPMQVTLSTSALSQSLSDKKALPVPAIGSTECKRDGTEDVDSGDSPAAPTVGFRVL